MNHKVTLKDVAKEAGVSTQTVSRVINNHPDVSEATRQRIKAIVSKLGYSPNIIARSLIQGKTHTLGIVGFGLEYYGSSSLLMGIESKASELGYSVLLTLLNELDDPRMDQILNHLVSQQVDGLIWTVPARKNEEDILSEKIRNTSFPVIILNKDAAPGDNLVNLDNRYGGRLATQHLLDQGYQKIGIITGPPTWWESEERVEGWKETLGLAQNDPGTERLMVHGSWTSQSGEEALNELLAKSPDIDAVFVCNDQMSLGAYRAAHKLGKRIPEDLGLVGFDDIQEAGYFSPPLTTVHQNRRDLGALAVTRVMELIRDPKKNKLPDQNVSWIIPSLVVRESSIRQKKEKNSIS